MSYLLSLIANWNWDTIIVNLTVKCAFWTSGETTFKALAVLTVNADFRFAALFACWSTMVVVPHTSL